MTGRTLTGAEKARYKAALRVEERARASVRGLELAYAKAAREVLDSPRGSWAAEYFRGVRQAFLERLHRAREEVTRAEEHTTQVLGEVRGVLEPEGT